MRSRARATCARPSSACVVTLGLGERGRDGSPQLSDAGVEIGLLLQSQLQRPPRRPQRLRDAAEHPAQTAGAVRRQQPHPVGMLAAAELGQRRHEGLGPQHARLALVEHSEPRVDAGRRRIGAQQPVAEAVNGRDPGAVELAGEIGAAGLHEPRPDARAQLARSALGEGHDEDRVDVDAALDRAQEALDDDRRLAGAGAGGDEHDACRIDRSGLLRIGCLWLEHGAHGRLTRQIGPRSHHDGHAPPFGS